MKANSTVKCKRGILKYFWMKVWIFKIICELFWCDTHKWIDLASDYLCSRRIPKVILWIHEPICEPSWSQKKAIWYQLRIRDSSFQVACVSCCLPNHVILYPLWKCFMLRGVPCLWKIWYENYVSLLKTPKDFCGTKIHMRF